MRNALRQMFGSLLPRLPLGRNHRVGLHLGGERLNVAQMRETASGLAFRAAASVDIGCSRDEMLAEPRRLKQVVKRVWAEHPFSGKDVVACMPHDQLKVFSVNYTAAEGQSDAQAIAREIRERLNGNTDGMVVDFVPVRRADSDDPSKEAVVAAATRDHVIAYLELLSGAGLTVTALDIGPTALTRVVPWAGKSTGGDMRNVLLINFGSACSYLTVMWGRRLMLDRAVERVRTTTTGQITALQGDVRDLSLGESQFDIIIAASVLHHLREDSEWKAVLAKCGPERTGQALQKMVSSGPRSCTRVLLR